MMNPAEFANIAQAEDQFWWYRGMRRILFRMLDPYVRGARFDRVLEAGCGTGHFALALERRYGWKMFPADLAREGLEYALSLGAQRLTQADISALPFASASFDALVSMDVMVHLPPGREAAALSEFARVTKPGGLVVLRVAALDILRSRHSEFCMERQRFTRSRLLRAAAAVGLEVLRSSYANSLLLPVALVVSGVASVAVAISSRRAPSST